MPDNPTAPFAERAHHKMIYPDQKIHEMVNENERLRAELAASAEVLEMVDAAIKYWCDGSMNEIIQSDLLNRAARCTAAAKRAREAGW